MNKEKDYIQDIAEIRSMMERSSKFLSLSGWAGIMAGIYALAGAYIAHDYLGFNPDSIDYNVSNLSELIMLASGVLILALITAIFFSRSKAAAKGEQIWTATSRRLLSSMSVPLVIGGALIVLLISKGLIGLSAPLMLIFYGLALYNAGSFTIKEVRIMGFVQILLGLLNAVFIEYGMLFWAIGFGAVHLAYGIYMHFRFER